MVFPAIQKSKFYAAEQIVNMISMKLLDTGTDKPNFKVNVNVNVNVNFIVISNTNVNVNVYVYVLVNIYVQVDYNICLLCR